MGERASEAGSRRQSCENGGGLPSRPGQRVVRLRSNSWASGKRDRVEGALVEGRRPGSWKQPSLTRRRAETGLVFGAIGWVELAGRKPRGRSLERQDQRWSSPDDRSAPSATEDVRGHVANPVSGRQRRGQGDIAGGPADRSARQERAMSRSCILSRLRPRRSRETMSEGG
jgi:hypothetical protein